MIDDGKNDPPEVKIENHVGSLTHFKLWEQELDGYTLAYFRPKTLRERFTAAFWAGIENVGRAFVNPDRPTNEWGGFIE